MSTNGPEAATLDAPPVDNDVVIAVRQIVADLQEQQQDSQVDLLASAISLTASVIDQIRIGRTDDEVMDLVSNAKDAAGSAAVAKVVATI